MRSPNARNKSTSKTFQNNGEGDDFKMESFASANMTERATDGLRSNRAIDPIRPNISTIKETDQDLKIDGPPKDKVFEDE
jgi:hypothetical protein|tara:strand:- start:185 stop:424 length:240 start_codon:yes stop_codon:yes gene_type:complete